MGEINMDITPSMTKGITGFNLCAFLIGLEGWRRGLTLTYYSDINEYSPIKTQGKGLIGRSYSLSSQDKTHYFNQSRGDLVSNEAVKIAQSKQKTKEALKANGVSVLPSIEFKSNDTNETIIEKAKDIEFPVIIKPTYGSLSKGVMLNIKNETELSESLMHVRTKMGFKSVILEKYFEGADIRLYVINGKVVAALKREPAKVTGDGTNTIKELIVEKNMSRQKNPYLAARPIKIDRELKTVIQNSNYTLDSVLEKGKTILVKQKSTLTQGVDLYDITDQIADDIKQLGIDTLNSLPDIIHGSIDMLYDGKNAVVLEVNASANISMHMFPTEGKPRNIGAHLMDLYFPETKIKSKSHYQVYFDYNHIVDVLKRNYTSFIKVRSLPDYPLFAKRYIINGKVQKVGYRNWVRRKAISNNLHGFAHNLEDGSVEVVVAGAKNDVEVFKSICAKGPKKAKVNQVLESVWSEVIKIGFEIDTITSSSQHQSEATLKKMEEENNKLKAEVRRLNQELKRNPKTIKSRLYNKISKITNLNKT